MAATLAPVFVNDSRIALQGDPKPQVAKIIEACGKQANDCEVVRLTNQTDVQGKTLSPGDFIDRTTQVAPVYLKCVDRENPSSAGLGASEASPQWRVSRNQAKDAPKKDEKHEDGAKENTPNAAGYDDTAALDDEKDKDKSPGASDDRKSESSTESEDEYEAPKAHGMRKNDGEEE